MFDPEDVTNQLRDVDRFIHLAEQAAERDQAETATAYAQLALSRAIASIAVAIVNHTQQQG